VRGGQLTHQLLSFSRRQNLCPTVVDLDALLTRYGVTSESTRERLYALNKGARERAWWDKYKDDISPIYLNYVGFEAGAAFIRQFQTSFLPGLLQTADYAEAVTVNSVDARKVASVVSLRLQRQVELAKREPRPRQYYVMDEAVIHRRIGIAKDPAIMPDQLRDIADKAEQDDLITVRVIPFDAGAHRGLSGPFTLLEFDGGLPDVLYIDAGRMEFASMVVGNFAAIQQSNVKRMLAYSSIAHAGYVLVAVTADSATGSAAAMFYLAAYAFTNLGAFAVVTYFSRQGEKYVAIEDFAGLSQRQPAMAAMLTIFLLSLIGVPLTAGFFGKFYIFKAVLDANEVWITVLGLLNSAVAAYYYLRVLVVMYFKEPGDSLDTLDAPGIGLKIAVYASALGTLVLGIFPGWVLDIATRAALK